MNLTTRAARQLQTLDPGQAAALLDRLRDRPHLDSTSIVEVVVGGQGFRCFVGRHRDGSRVLLGIVAHCTARRPGEGGKPRDGPPGVL